MSGALVLQRGPLTQQPQQAVPVDWSNPLARGLRVAVVPGLPVNLVTGKALTASTVPALSVSERGRHLAYNGTAGTVYSTDYYPGTIGDHSGVVIARSSAINGTGWSFIATRTGYQEGFSFSVDVSSTQGSYPNQTAPFRYTNCGLADYNSTTRVQNYGQFSVLGFSATNGSDCRFFQSGAYSSSVTIGSCNPATDPLQIGGDPLYSGVLTADLPLVLYWNRRLSDAEHASIAANPWQLFNAPRRRLWLAVNNTAGAALSGTASAVASATGGLTTSIRLSTSAAVVASASGTLSTQIALSGAAAGQATASGSLTTQIRAAGSAGAVAAASGALSTQIALSGTAAASSSASGALTAGTGLSGSASASSSASGALTTSIALAGSASCTSSVSGALSTTPVGAALSGTASASASASGSLTTSIALAGAAVAQASASGSFAGQAAALLGSASASSSASGSLSTQIVVAGAAQAVANAVGSLTTAIRLAGAAACSSNATGALSTGLLPPEPNPHRMIVVPRRKRHFVARRRVRHFEVGR